MGRGMRRGRGRRKGREGQVGGRGTIFTASDTVFSSTQTRLPLKWMAIESLDESHEFTTQSDV